MGGKVKLLLDTHALLWWLTDAPELSAKARAAIANERNRILVSAASAWELATKHRLGKLEQASEALFRFNELLTADGFEHLPVNYLHAIKAGAYDSEHRDPFDRMLAAQSELETATLVSCDQAFRDLGTKTLW
jgi:PIN domain nuclease of toxin-antitoxin system